MSRRALLLLSVLPAIAFAESGLVGWGAKGSIAVVKVVQSMGTIGSITSMTVYDLKAGTQRRFQITPDDPQSDDQPGPDSKDWEAWQAQNPLQPATASQTSPDGKVKLDVAARGTKATGWSAEHQRFDFQAQPLGCPEDGLSHPGGCGARPSSVVLTLVQGSKRRTAAGFELRGNAEHVQPFWSPDGAHLAVLSSEDFFGDVGTTSDTVVFARLDTPSFEVLTADPSAASTKAVLTALQKLDAWPVRVGKALQARAASVVFAAKGNEATARAFAAAVPGGATVEPLTWKSDCDLVVAVGASAK